MKLFICGVSEVDQMLQNHPEITQVVSIGDKGDYIPNFPPSVRLLRLEMADVAFTDQTNIDKPEKSDVEKVWEFAQGIDLQNDSVLCHCYAGQSRSTAIGCMLKVLEFGNSALGIEKAVQDVLRARDIAMPNRLLISMVDDRFQCKGLLMKTVDRICRGIL